MQAEGSQQWGHEEQQCQPELCGFVKNLDSVGLPAHIVPMETVELTPAASRQLEALPKKIHARVLSLLERLERWPAVSGVKPLGGELAGWYRMRTGDYRLRFRLQGERIIVDKIGHRREFYED